MEEKTAANMQALANMSHQHGTRGASASTDKKLFDASNIFRFTQNTDEYKLLQKLMLTGQIQPSDRPSDIKDRYELFAKISVNSFRSQFNKLKGLCGVNTKTGKNSELI